MEKGILLPCFYLGPIAYYRQILGATGAVLLESQEHFPKQTYRNRARIHAANGRLDLTVPVQKSASGRRLRMRDALIVPDSDWQRLHWRSLSSAYRRSAYFEYYEDQFAVFYEQPFRYLLDLNLGLHELILSLLKVDRPFSLTTEYKSSYEDLLDLRSSIHPKKEAAEGVPYFQVFEPKNGFIPDLSIVDLLFNQGPSSKHYLG